MKIKKARKRLERVEGLLTDVLHGYTTTDHPIHDLLDRAKAAVSEAVVRLQKSAAKKPPARARELSASGQTASVKKRQIKDVKRTGAKRSGIHTANGRSLRKTA